MLPCWYLKIQNSSWVHVSPDWHLSLRVCLRAWERKRDLIVSEVNYLSVCVLCFVTVIQISCVNRGQINILDSLDWFLAGCHRLGRVHLCVAWLTRVIVCCLSGLAIVHALGHVQSCITWFSDWHIAVLSGDTGQDVFSHVSPDSMIDTSQVLSVRCCQETRGGTCSDMCCMTWWLTPVLLSVRCHQGTQWDMFSRVGPDSVIDTCHAVCQVSPGDTGWGMFSLSVLCHLIQWLTPVMCCLSGIARGHRMCSVMCHLIQWLTPVMRCQSGIARGHRMCSVMCHLIQRLTPVMCCLSGIARGHRVGCLQSGLPRGWTHQNCECIQYYCCVISITRVWSFIFFVTREVNVGFVFSIIALQQLWDILTDEWCFNSGCSSETSRAGSIRELSGQVPEKTG